MHENETQSKHLNRRITGTVRRPRGAASRERNGADAVDFNTCGRKWDYRNPDSVYSKSDDEICSYYADLRKYADSIGLEIGQTHGQIKGFIDKTEDDEALIANGRIDCMAASALGAPYVVMHSVTTNIHGSGLPCRKKCETSTLICSAASSRSRLSLC